ncbi:MAG: hypothetical protein H6970_15425 [Gammaproteobacteria bacterium]|nr:hypothetical protein [Gammaproteobacteria bacterium]MCP5458708.1 hypothetical protein [Gammaproteobacteria bacterium]
MTWPNKQALILVGGIAAVVGFYVWLNWKPDIPVDSQARAPGVQPVDSVPGGRQTAEYGRLQGMANHSRADVAEQQGASAVPSPPTLESLAGGEGPPRSPATVPAPTPATPPPSRNAAPRSSDPDRRIAEMARAMQQQAKELVQFREQRFNPKPTRMTTFEDVRGRREQAAAESSPDQATPVIPQDRSGALQPGDILYAVLQTAINSDEPGPVRAKVTGERFKGAILLGMLKNFPPVTGSRPERVLVSFNYLTTPDRVTHNIQGYAIDLDTARTALATGVDHHYLSRWGSLIAASFLEGYGNAVRYSNSTTTVGPLGNVVTVGNGNIDNEAIAREALGTVGERLADAVQENYQRPNTISVEAGTGLGVLIVAPTVEQENTATAASSAAPALQRTPSHPTQRSTTFPDGVPVSPVFPTAN